MNYIIAIRTEHGHNEVFTFETEEEAEEFISSLPANAEYARAQYPNEQHENTTIKH